MEKRICYLKCFVDLSWIFDIGSRSWSKCFWSCYFRKWKSNTLTLLGGKVLLPLVKLTKKYFGACTLVYTLISSTERLSYLFVILSTSDLTNVYNYMQMTGKSEYSIRYLLWTIAKHVNISSKNGHQSMDSFLYIFSINLFSPEGRGCDYWKLFSGQNRYMISIQNTEKFLFWLQFRWICS